MVKTRYVPNVLVCQCGADGLAADPMESFNLTPLAYSRCVQYLMAWNVPLLLVGGGRLLLSVKHGDVSYLNDDTIYSGHFSICAIVEQFPSMKYDNSR